jgi:hypothetical protein
LISSGLDTAIPTITHRSKYAPWWTPSLSWIHKQITWTKRRLQNHSLESSKSNDKIRLRILTDRWIAATHKAKIAFWHKKLLESNQQSIWRIIRKHNTHIKPIPPLLGKNGFEKKYRILRESLFPTALTSPDHLPEKSILSPCNLQDEFYPVTTREVTSTVNRAKLDTATGPDKISSTIRLFHLTSPSTPPALFNALFRYRNFPKRIEDRKLRSNTKKWKIRL